MMSLVAILNFAILIFMASSSEGHRSFGCGYKLHADASKINRMLSSKDEKECLGYYVL